MMLPHKAEHEACTIDTNTYRKAWGQYLTDINCSKPRGRSTPKAQRNLHYDIPNPLESSLQYDRFNHLDLAELPLEALKSEKRRVQHVLDFSERPSHWLLQRLNVINHVLTERQHSPDQKFEPSYPRRLASRVERYRRQIHADPYFGQPERKSQGITPATIVHKGTADG